MIHVPDFFKEVENSTPSYGNANSTSVVVCGVLAVETKFILYEFLECNNECI